MSGERALGKTVKPDFSSGSKDLGSLSAGGGQLESLKLGYSSSSLWPLKNDF